MHGSNLGRMFWANRRRRKHSLSLEAEETPKSNAIRKPEGSRFQMPKRHFEIDSPNHRLFLDGAVAVVVVVVVVVAVGPCESAFSSLPFSLCLSSSDVCQLLSSPFSTTFLFFPFPLFSLLHLLSRPRLLLFLSYLPSFLFCSISPWTWLDHPRSRRL